MPRHTLLGRACDQTSLIQGPLDTIISIERVNYFWLTKISWLDRALRHVKRWPYWEAVKPDVQGTREDGSCLVHSRFGIADMQE